MKFLTNTSLFLLFIGLLITACNRENVDEIIIKDPNYEPEVVEQNNLVSALTMNETDGLDLGCLLINYPFELLLASGETVTINSIDDFEAAGSEDNPDPVVDFVFPLNITDTEGNLTEVNTIDELGQVFASCIPETGWDNPGTIPAFLFDDLCFDLVFPFNLEDLEDNTYTAANEAEFIDLLATTDDLFITLPINVVYNDEELTIDSIGGFFDLVFLCDGINPPVSGDGIVVQGFGCNQLQFPFEVLLEDGSTLTVTDVDQYANLILSGESIELLFPFSLMNLDGEIMVIEDIEDLINALIACGVDIEIIDNNDEPCSFAPAHIFLFFNQGVIPCGYNINFPVQVEAEGVVYNLNNMSDYYTVYGMYNNQINAIEIIYPVGITLIEDGSTLTFQEDNEICSFINGCQ
ncbi:MAG TPA: hypothetical protein PKA00_18770 [Saprospiraceae bacterium]|nr:hypothetical protein [Saprospiraceae bacterium]HMQ84964.1 hypothetical protein [Saprospiraceae bacterium]